MIENTQQMNQLTGSQAELAAYLSNNYVDLASARVDGKALSCSDDFFAEMENLLEAGRGVFIDDKYTDRGKWMDGWESRRSYGRGFRLESGLDYDWCVIRLGMSGRIKGFDIDTNYFRGNAPQLVAVEACNSKEEPSEQTQWTNVLDKTSVVPHSQNIFAMKNDNIWTHVRLRMYPDGGIARFRVYGEVVVNWDESKKDELVDLAFIKNGAKALLVSDMFFSDKNNLIMPERGKDMGDGWETKRRRDPGPDWSIIKLATEGTVEQIIIDTCHFKGNFPDTFSLEGTVSGDDDFTDLSDKNDRRNWQLIVDKTKLSADKEHYFSEEILVDKLTTFTHLRLSIYPDGGVSRMRVLGHRK